jgi:hypothetical protein
LLRPTVDILLQREHYEWNCKALIDTGAPFTLFDRGSGEALGIDFSRRGARTTRHRIAGGDYTAQMESVTIHLEPFGDLWWESEVGFFVEDWGMPFQGILGHAGFLDRWVVSFNYYDNYFIVEERDAFVERMPPDHESAYQDRDLGWRDSR